MTNPDVGVVLPVRSFDGAYTRLADALSPAQRAQLAEALADQVRRAIAPLPVVVVSSDAAVCAWAGEHGLETIADPGSLSEAVAAGQRHWAALGARQVVAVHADLPRLTDLDAVLAAAGPGTAVLVPCHRNDGTTVLCIPTDAAFTFAYGPGSFAAHRAAAVSAGLTVAVVDEPTLQFDIDVPADLAGLPATVAEHIGYNRP